MKPQDKKQRLLKAKIGIALQDEFGRVPTEDEIGPGVSLNARDVEGCFGPAL
jgi:hypothetical protein